MPRNILVIAGLILMLFSNPVQAENDRDRPREKDSDKKVQEKKTDEAAREEACDCCMKCIAATRSITGKEEGPPATDGCRDCCERCGTMELPLQQDNPPEIKK